MVGLAASDSVASGLARDDPDVHDPLATLITRDARQCHQDSTWVHSANGDTFMQTAAPGSRDSESMGEAWDRLTRSLGRQAKETHSYRDRLEGPTRQESTVDTGSGTPMLVGREGPQYNLTSHQFEKAQSRRPLLRRRATKRQPAQSRPNWPTRPAARGRHGGARVGKWRSRMNKHTHTGKKEKEKKGRREKRQSECLEHGSLGWDRGVESRAENPRPWSVGRGLVWSGRPALG